MHSRSNSKAKKTQEQETKGFLATTRKLTQELGLPSPVNNYSGDMQCSKLMIRDFMLRSFLPFLNASDIGQLAVVCGDFRYIPKVFFKRHPQVLFSHLQSKVKTVSVLEADQRKITETNANKSTLFLKQAGKTTVGLTVVAGWFYNSQEKKKERGEANIMIFSLLFLALLIMTALKIHPLMKYFKNQRLMNSTEEKISRILNYLSSLNPEGYRYQQPQGPTIEIISEEQQNEEEDREDREAKEHPRQYRRS